MNVHGNDRERAETDAHQRRCQMSDDPAARIRKQHDGERTEEDPGAELFKNGNPCDDPKDEGGQEVPRGAQRPQPQPDEDHPQQQREGCRPPVMPGLQKKIGIREQEAEEQQQRSCRQLPTREQREEYQSGRREPDPQQAPTSTENEWPDTRR